MRQRVLLVEDESAIADTVSYALRTDGFDCEWCASGAQALASFSRRPPDLVVLDVGLPDVHGFELFRRLRALGDSPVVFLTARGDEIDRVVGLELGADDYVAKPFSPRELVARIRGVLRRTAREAQGAGMAPRSTAAVAAGGTSPSAPADVGAPTAASAPAPAPTPAALPTAAPAPRLRHGPFDVDESRRLVRFLGQPLSLSRVEYGLLCALIRRPGHVYTREALLDAVWGDHRASLDRTVDAHVKTLRAKLKHVDPALDPIRTHRGVGYALADDAGTPAD